MQTLSSDEHLRMDTSKRRHPLLRFAHLRSDALELGHFEEILASHHYGELEHELTLHGLPWHGIVSTTSTIVCRSCDSSGCCTASDVSYKT